MNILFQINGGLGKCILSTAVCEAIKKKYPDSNLIVVSGYPDVFLNNPSVKKSLNFNNITYFYQDFIEDKDVKVFFHDPYLETSYIKEEAHLIKIWCEMFDIPYNGEQPKLYFTQRELDAFQRQIVIDKPMFLLQSNGGADANRKYSWARDIPREVVEKVIDEFKEVFRK